MANRIVLAAVATPAAAVLAWRLFGASEWLPPVLLVLTALACAAIAGDRGRGKRVRIRVRRR